jgi:O-antigen ligase
VKIYIILMVLFAISYPIAYNLIGRTLRRHVGPLFVIWFALITLAGFYAPSAMIYNGFATIVTLATVRDRLDAVCRYVLAIALLPTVIWRLYLGPVYFGDFNVHDFLGIALLLYGYANPRPAARPLRGFRVEDAFVALVLFIFWVAKLRFPSASLFLKEGLSMFTMIVVPYLLFRNHVRSIDEFRRVLACLMFGAAILSLYAVYEATFGWAMFGVIEVRLWESGTMVSKSFMQRGGALRASTTMAGPLSLAFFFALALVVTFTMRDFIRQRWAWICWLLALFVGLLMTQSRGNTACFVLGYVIYCIVRRKYGLAAASAGGGALVALLVMFGAQFSSTLAGFLNLNAGGIDGVYDYRELLLQRGLEEGMKNPLFGTSLADALLRLEDITQGQQIVDLVNTYLNIFLISGLAGLLPLTALAFMMLRKQIVGYRAIRDKALLSVRAVVITMFVVMLVELSFMSFIDRVPMLLMLIAAGSRLIGFERARLLRSGTAMPSGILRPERQAETDPPAAATLPAGA